MSKEMRDASTEFIKENGLVFTSHNDGSRLIVEGRTCYIDFWPGTGRWKTRTGIEGFGAASLVTYAKGNSTMKIGFIGTVTEKELRLLFDLTADSTPETETPEEKDKRFDSILLDWHQEVTKV